MLTLTCVTAHMCGVCLTLSAASMACCSRVCGGSLHSKLYEIYVTLSVGMHGGHTGKW